MALFKFCVKQVFHYVTFGCTVDMYSNLDDNRHVYCTHVLLYSGCTVVYSCTVDKEIRTNTMLCVGVKPVLTEMRQCKVGEHTKAQKFGLVK